jgi:hypothetical protein
MFAKDGLYMSHGAEGRVLTVIVQDNRHTEVAPVVRTVFAFSLSGSSCSCFCFCF